MDVLVTDYGVKVNCKDIQTICFQKAIDDCYKNGGGKVIVPYGNYYIGGIRLRSNITLYLKEGAHLIGSKKIEDYSIIYNDSIDSVPDVFLPENPYSP